MESDLKGFFLTFKCRYLILANKAQNIQNLDVLVIAVHYRMQMW